ncbi:homoserine O-succinyltransferase [Campylobacter coli]|nr:homoserine O-succinyltransferase [Campylobacter coli]MBX2178324.1 homoserine O-succinyltransferase [Campylobacter coli]
MMCIKAHLLCFDDLISCSRGIVWRSNANTIFANWLNYDVYQSTPFVL